MKILLDLDGVMANFVKAACEAHQVSNPYLKKENHGNFLIADCLGMSDHDFWRKTHGPDFWEEMEVMPDAHAFLGSINRYGLLDQTCICSAPSADPDSMVGKHRWIINHLPNFRRRFMFTPFKEVAAHEGSILIDDRDSNVLKFASAGGRAILVPRPWNSRHRRSLRAADVVALELAEIMGDTHA